MILTALISRPALMDAQQPRFTQQIILVPVPEGRDRKLADAMGDRLREHLQRAYRKAETNVVSERSMELLLERAGIERLDSDTVHIRVMARQLRADEIVHASVERVGPQRLRVSGRLLLTRDIKRLVLTLTSAEGPTTDSAGALFAKGVIQARRQLVSHRLCENALREFEADSAIGVARNAIRQGTDGALLRTCLVSAMLMKGDDSRRILAEATQLLAIDSTSFFGLDAAARAQDVLGQRDAAASMWLRLYRGWPNDTSVSRRVVRQLLAGGNASHARPVITALSDSAPDDLELLRMRWQVLYTVRAWDDAGRIGDRLAAEDKRSQDDSTFALGLALTHRNRGDSVKAVAIAATGATRFKGDARLYVLYTDLVQADARAAVVRGLALFPQAAELHLLRAQELKRSGKTSEAIAPFQRAMALDSTLGQGYLALAQAHAELGQTDSALVVTRRALRAGEPTTAVAQFVLSRGNAMLREAGNTKQRGDYQHAMMWLGLADSLQTTPQSRFLLGTAALTIAQSAATEAPTTRDCELSRLSGGLVPLAREKITAGAAAAPDAARQYLGYLDQLEETVAQQITALCNPK